MDYKNAVVGLSLLVVVVLSPPRAAGQTSESSPHSAANVFRWLSESGNALISHRSEQAKNQMRGTYGVRSKEASPRDEYKIARGRDVAPGEWPFVVLIFRVLDREQESFASCTGTLVAPDWILTAAHCLVGEDGSVANPSDVFVVVGHDLIAINNSVQQGDTTSVRQATQVVPHPQYSTLILGRNDIGLIQLDQPFPITPIKILTPAEEAQYAPSGTTAVAVGWGQTENGEHPTILQQVNVPLLSLTECRRRLRPFGLGQPDGTFCAGTAAEGARSGDSGGPLLVRFRSVWGQVGVASLASRDPELVGFPATYVQISAHYDWIHQHISVSGGGPDITLNSPSNLTAEAIGSSQIRLTWRDNSTNESGFRIERRSSGTDWNVVVWTGRNRTLFVDAGLNPASTYSYRVLAWNDEVTSAFSNTATATTSSSGGGGGGGTISLNKWVIPTMANSPGRHGAYYRTKVILSNFDSDLDLTIRLYGPGGAVAWRHRSIEANYYRTWNNFLEEVFDYRGTGAVEFSGNAPFTVSAEVYTTSSQGKYTTVVHNGPAPLTPYLSLAASVGVVAVDGATRTNAGVFNNSNRSQTVTARVYYPDSDSEDPDETLTFSLPPKGWAQKSVSARGERGYIFWRIPREAYLWVVSVGNRSNDGTLAVPTPLE